MSFKVIAFVSASSQNLVIDNRVWRLFRTQWLFAGWVMGVKGCESGKGSTSCLYREGCDSERQYLRPEKQENQVCVFLVTEEPEFLRVVG